jgi:Chalcone isomerase-like
MRARTLLVPLTACAALLALGSPSRAQDVAEPRSGVRFPAQVEGMSLLGTGLRTRTMLKVKVYAIGLYADGEALKGPLAAFKGRTTSPDFYKALVWGDFPRQVTLKFARDVTRDQIQGAFREVLTTAEKAKADAFVGYFGDTKSGQEYVIRWTPGRGLLSTVAGQEKAAIDDKNFAAAVFGIWLGDKPIQDDIKRDLVARAPQLMP